MTELTVAVHCYAALALFRAALPERLAAETGLGPDDLGVAPDLWRRGCRGAGSVLLAVACALAWFGRGTFEGLMVWSSAAMFACVAVVLLAPVARRLTWGLAAAAFALCPVLAATTLASGGSYGF